MAEPKLRFKRDDGSDYPEWLSNKLKNICSDFVVPMRDKPKIFDGDIPWCRIEDIEGKYFNTSLSGQFVSEKTIKEMNLKVYPKGTVICSCSASIGSYAISTRPLITNQTFIGLVCSNRIYNEFLLYCMMTQTEKLKKNAGGTTILYISRDNFEEHTIEIPCLEEQQKIADFLSAVDEVIAESEKEAANLETQKKAVMKKIFSQEIRFTRPDGFPFPDWKESKLEDVVEFLDGQRKPIETGERIPGPYPYYGASGITDFVNDYIFDEDLILLSEDGANILDRNYRVCFMARGKYWVNNHAHVLRAHIDCINEYICEYLESLDYKRMNSGSAQPKLNQQTCRIIPVKKPCLEEQKLIADFLSDFDEAIAAAKKELSLWKQLKKALLQQLFV